MRTPCPRLRLGAFCWAQRIGSAAQRLAGLSVAVAVEVGVALAQQLLGAGIGADLPAAVPAAAGCGAIGDDRSGFSVPVLFWI